VDELVIHAKAGKDAPMTQLIGPQPTATPPETDLVAEVQRVLGASPEPLTLPKIRSALRPPFRSASPEELTECLRRQVAANVVIVYPRYRSQQDRYWDRPMNVHIAGLMRKVLEAGPLPWSEVRRKLPGYALGQPGQAEAVLQEQLAQGMLYRHPRTGGRGKDRFGAEPPDPKEYLRAELAGLFRRLEQLGFSQTQLRSGALELLQEEEWGPAPAAARPEEPSAEARPAAGQAALPALAAPAPAGEPAAVPGEGGTGQG
jgi:hypothetical protein